MAGVNIPPHVSELILATVPDEHGKLHMPARDRSITVQGPISLEAFLYGLRACKSLRVLPCH